MMGKFAIRNLYEKRSTGFGPSNSAASSGQDLLYTFTEPAKLSITSDARSLSSSPSSKESLRKRKLKPFFTFAFRKRPPAVDFAAPTEQPVGGVDSVRPNDSNTVHGVPTSGIGSPILSKSATAASAPPPFLGEPTPLWTSSVGRRRRRVKSEASGPVTDFVSPLGFISDSSLTSSAKTQAWDRAGLLDKSSSPFERPSTPFSIFDPFYVGSDEGATQLYQSFDGNQHSIVAASLLSPSTASETAHVSVMMLPAPPIIVSSPTPPNFGRLEDSELQHQIVLNTLGGLDLELEGHHHPQRTGGVTTQDGLSKMLEMVQKAARQLEHEKAHHAIYQYMTPIMVFLYVLVMATALPRRQTEIIAWLGVDEGYTALCFLLLTLLGVPFVLMALKITIWILGRLCQSFCALDVQESFGKGACVDYKGERAGDADLIVGNFLF